MEMTSMSSQQQQQPGHQPLGAGDAQQQQANNLQWANMPVSQSVASMAFNKHWSSLFRRPPDDAQQQQGGDPSNTYAFCQTKLLASTKDLGRLISDASERFERDQDGIRTLLEECREVVKVLAEKSVARDTQHSEMVTGELISIRAIVGTVADLNLALRAKLIKMDATVENLVVLANKIENRIGSNEREIANISTIVERMTTIQPSKTPPKTPARAPQKRAPTTTPKRPVPAKKRATGRGIQSSKSQMLNPSQFSLNANPLEEGATATAAASYELLPPSPAQTTSSPQTPLPDQNPIPSPSTLGKKSALGVELALGTPSPTTSVETTANQTTCTPIPRKRGRPAKSQGLKKTIIDLTLGSERASSSSSSPTVSEHSDSGSSASESTTALSPNGDCSTTNEIKQEDVIGVPSRCRRQTRSFTKKRKITETEDGVEETNTTLWDGGVIAYGGGERHLKFR